MNKEQMRFLLDKLNEIYNSPMNKPDADGYGFLVPNCHGSTQSWCLITDKGTPKMKWHKLLEWNSYWQNISEVQWIVDQ